MYFQSDKVGYFLCDHILIQKYFKYHIGTTYKVQIKTNATTANKQKSNSKQSTIPQ